jgi:hypothetical protein
MVHKTTVYLPDDLKERLTRAAAESGQSEAELIREGIRMAIDGCLPPSPTVPILVSDDPDFAERADERLAGFGER